MIPEHLAYRKKDWYSLTTKKWQEFVKKTQALSKETQTSAKSSLDSITTNRILHGISYNKYGKES